MRNGAIDDQTCKLQRPRRGAGTLQTHDELGSGWRRGTSETQAPGQRWRVRGVTDSEEIQDGSAEGLEGGIRIMKGT